MNESEEREVRTLTLEEINEQNKSFIGSLRRQLKDLIPFLQGLSVASHPNYYPKVHIRYRRGSLRGRMLARQTQQNSKFLIFEKCRTI